MARHPVPSSSGKPLLLLSLKELEVEVGQDSYWNPVRAGTEKNGLFVEEHHF